MKDILNLINDIPRVRGSLVIDKEGLVIASNLMSGLEERTISAMVAAVYLQVVRSLAEGKEDEIHSVQLLASEVNIIFLCAQHCILIVITEAEANIGLVSIKMKASLERLMDLL
jgi:predicted regulator of Ras-like GTPase activity (Roadblock/LC7/MglB family)